MQTLENFVFSTTRQGRYPWDTILDGKAHRLEEGKDYECETTTITQMARNRAKKRGLSLQVQKVEGGVVMQAVKATPKGEEKAPVALAANTSPAAAKEEKGKGKKAG